MITILQKRPLFPSPGQQALDGKNCITSGLFGYWPCNEGGGLLVKDITGSYRSGGNDGIYSGTTPLWEMSPYGPALKLDGSTNYLKIANSFPLLSPGNQITVSLWLFWRASTEAYNCIVTNEAVGNWTFMIRSDQTPAFYNGGGADPISASTIPFNQWIHLVFAWEAGNVGTTARVYVNGILNNSGTLGNSGGSGVGETRFGGHAPFGSGRWLNGSIRDIGLWTRALTVPEIQQLYIKPGLLLKPPLRFFPVLAVAAVPLTETLTDTMSLSDECDIQLNGNIVVGLNDTLSMSDLIIEFEGGTLVLSDTLSLSDAISLILSLEIAQSESLSLSDTLGVADMSLTELDIRDFMVLQDFLATSAQTYLALSDTMSLSDIIALSLAFTALNLSDSLSLSDSLTLNLSGNIQISLADTLILSDAISLVVNQSFNSYLRRYLNDTL